MTIGSIRLGDIIRVDDGMPYLAMVEQYGQGHGARTLVVRPLHGSRSLRGVKAREVVAHWRRMGKMDS